MKNKILKVLLLFIIGCAIGAIVNIIIYIFNQSFNLQNIWQYIVLVHGIGAVIYYWLYNSLMQSEQEKVEVVLIIFLLTIIIGELITFVFTEINDIFSTKIIESFFELTRGTSIRQSIYWALTGIAYYITTVPLINKINGKLIKI